MIHKDNIQPKNFYNDLYELTKAAMATTTKELTAENVYSFAIANNISLDDNDLYFLDRCLSLYYMSAQDLKSEYKLLFDTLSEVKSQSFSDYMKEIKARQATQ